MSLVEHSEIDIRLKRLDRVYRPGVRRDARLRLERQSMGCVGVGRTSTLITVAPVYAAKCGIHHLPVPVPSLPWWVTPRGGYCPNRG